jgi:WD40 repeat protein
LPYLAYTEAEGTICVVDTRTWQRVLTLADADDCGILLAFDRRLPRLAFARQGGCVSVWNIPSNQKVVSHRASDTPATLSFAAGGEMLAVVAADGSCRILATTTGQVVHEFAEAKLACGLFVPNRPLFLTATAGGRLALRDGTTFQLLRRQAIPCGEVCQFAVSPATPAFAVRSADGVVHVWDFADDIVRSTIRTRADRVTPICFTADGRALLIGGVDCCVRRIVQVESPQGIATKKHKNSQK